MADRKIDVLFVSRRGSIRSILAAALLRHYGKDRFSAHACGMGREPVPRPHPQALASLRSVGIDPSGLSAQDWSVYSRSQAAPMNYVILLDEGVVNNMPTWPGNPIVATWEYPDLIGVTLSDADLQAALQRLMFSMRRRIELFASLPFKTANRTDLTSDVRDLAHLEPYAGRSLESQAPL